MELFEIMKQMGSPTKFKIISFLWDCKHEKVPFKIFQKSFGLNQPNLSKQMNELVESDIVIKESSGRERYYKINKNFAKPNENIVVAIINSDEAKKYKCICYDGIPSKGRNE